MERGSNQIKSPLFIIHRIQFYSFEIGLDILYSCIKCSSRKDDTGGGND